MFFITVSLHMMLIIIRDSAVYWYSSSEYDLYEVPVKSLLSFAYERGKFRFENFTRLNFLNQGRNASCVLFSMFAACVYAEHGLQTLRERESVILQKLGIHKQTGIEKKRKLVSDLLRIRAATFLLGRTPDVAKFGCLEPQQVSARSRQSLLNTLIRVMQQSIPGGIRFSASLNHQCPTFPST
jgi:hypothetical protein